MKLLTVLSVAIAAAVLLAGCAPSSHHGSGSSGAAGGASASHSSTAGPTAVSTHAAATPTPTAALPPNAIIRVTATVTASTGAVARLVETVLAPTAAAGTEGAAMSAAGCDNSEWRSQFPHPSWTHVSTTATLLSGANWPTEDSVLVFAGSYWGYSAWSGAWGPFEAQCSDGLVTVPGAAQAILPVDATAAPGTQNSATAGPFGFVWASDADDPSSMHFSFTGCTIEAGPTAGAAQSYFVRQPASGGYPAMCETAKP